MEKSESITELAAALSAAQAEIKDAHKDATNPDFKSKYATLESVFGTIRPTLSKHGLAVSQFCLPTVDGNVGLETMLMHKSGEWILSAITLKATKDDAQGAGSAITYARRYALSAIVGIATEDDDDGNQSARQGGKDHKPSGRQAQRDDAPPAPPPPTEQNQSVYGITEPQMKKLCAEFKVIAATTELDKKKYTEMIRYIAEQHCGEQVDSLTLMSKKTATALIELFLNASGDVSKMIKAKISQTT